MAAAVGTPSGALARAKEGVTPVPDPGQPLDSYRLAALEAGHAEIVAESGQRARRRQASYSQQAFLLLASTSVPRTGVRSNALTSKELCDDSACPF